MRRPLLTAAALFGLTLPFLRRREEVLGTALKLGAAFAAVAAVDRMHPEGTDPDDYHAAGARIADRLRSGRLDGLVEIARTTPYDTRDPLVGTNAVRMLTGWVYAVTGADKRTGFVVFSWLGLCGQLMFVRAFEHGLPEADARRYARLVLFTPSLAFWTAIARQGAADDARASGRPRSGAARRDARLAAAGAALAAAHPPARPRRRRVHADGPGPRAVRPAVAPRRGRRDGALPPVPARGRDRRSARLAAAEGAALLGLSLARARPPRRPYALFAAAASAGLIRLLRGVANFGVLNRRRGRRCCRSGSCSSPRRTDDRAARPLRRDGGAEPALPALRADARAARRRVRGRGDERAGRVDAALEEEGIRHVAWPSAVRAWDPRADARAYRELRTVVGGYDVVHTHTPKPGVMGRVAARRAGVPVVVNTVHGYYATPEDPLPRRAAVMGIERLAATCSDLEIFQSREDLAWATRSGVVPAHKARFLGSGIDLERFDRAAVDPARLAALRAELGLAEGERVVTMIGRLTAPKGVRELVAAARAVRRERPDVRFVVVGGSDVGKEGAIGPRGAGGRGRRRRLRGLARRRRGRARALRRLRPPLVGAGGLAAGGDGGRGDGRPAGPHRHPRLPRGRARRPRGAARPAPRRPGPDPRDRAAARRRRPAPAGSGPRRRSGGASSTSGASSRR